MRRGWIGLGAFIVSISLLISPLVSNDRAYASDYPSWSDVLNARNDVALKEKAIAELKSIIKGLEKKVAAAAAEAERVGAIYQIAQQAALLAYYKLPIKTKFISRD